LSFGNACGKGGRLESVFKDIDTEVERKTLSPDCSQELKRAAASYFSEKSLVEVFKDTKIFAQNGYDNRDGQAILPNIFSESSGMKKGTILDVDPLPLDPPLNTKHTQIVMINQDSIDAALDPKNSLINPCVLNDANAFSPGGGVEGGSKGREEDIFRRTNYFESLCPEHNPKLADEITAYQATKKGQEMEASRPMSAAPHDRQNFLIPEHGGIYSPSVCVFRHNEDSGFDLMDQPILLSFVAVSAYNRKTSHKSKLVFGNKDYGPLDQKLYEEGTKRKIRAALRIAAKHGHEDLVLGAFGCGPFQNSPQVIARLYGDVLNEEEFKNRFRTIIFAILEKGTSKNLPSFCNESRLSRVHEEEAAVQTSQHPVLGSAAAEKKKRIQEITDLLPFVTEVDRDQLLEELDELLKPNEIRTFDHE
jgi:hypothetical protein